MLSFPRSAWERRIAAPRHGTMLPADVTRGPRSAKNTFHAERGNEKGCDNLLTTIKGSLMEGFLPAGWDLEKIDRLGALGTADVPRREKWWHPQFEPIACASYADFDTYMGHEIARESSFSHQKGSR